MKKNELLLIISLIIIDQIIKYIVEFLITSPIIVIDDIFEIILVKNYGISFSLFSNQRFTIILISVIAIGIIGRMLVEYKSEKILKIGLVMMMAGAVSNFLDRIFRGYVVDYLSFSVLKYDFAIFNFADTLLVVGALIVIINLFIKKVRSKD